MAKPKMTATTRAKLLAGLEAQMKVAEDRAAKAPNEQNLGYWAGVVDGLNRAFRYISTGEWET